MCIHLAFPHQPTHMFPVNRTGQTLTHVQWFIYRTEPAAIIKFVARTLVSFIARAETQSRALRLRESLFV